MSCILVTGAQGLVGSELCRVLSERGYLVHAVTRRQHQDDNSPVKKNITVGDIGLKTYWKDELHEIDCVVHLAARVHVMHDDARDPISEFRKINVDGTLNLARQAAESDVKRFIYVSSIKVNGESTSTNIPFTDKDEPNPTDAYAVSKYEAEQGLLEIAEQTKMDVVIIRPPLVYGPGVKANFLSMMSWLHRGIPLPFGSIHNKRSFVALDNLVDLILVCIEHPAAANEIFLVSDDEDLSTTELLKKMAIALNKPARLIPVPAWLLYIIAAIFGKRDMAKRLLGSLQVDIDKTRTLLNWNPPVSVKAALKTTADDYLTKH